MKKQFLSIGLMSGTSMDGIDAALLETTGLPGEVKSLANTSLDYPPVFKILLRATEWAVRQSNGILAEAEANFAYFLDDFLQTVLQYQEVDKFSFYEQAKIYLENSVIAIHTIIAHATDLHAQCVHVLLQKTNKNACDIQIIGFHGQTLFHHPEKKLSVTVGDGARLAAACGIPVINDFRQADILAGGQGAPFAPLYHHALAVRDGFFPMVVINCGGIANVTIIPSNNENDLIGFDTGPGNVLIDSYLRKKTKGAACMDANGQYGLKGQVEKAVLRELYEKSVMKNGHPYLPLLPPKSLDYGDLHLIAALDSLAIEDACCTLETFTAETIVQGLLLFKDSLTHLKSIILAGGGFKNPVITQALKQNLSAQFGDHLHIQQANEVGWQHQALEAEIFAYLAVRSLKQLPLSYPGTTAVSQPLTGGTLHRPSSRL